MDAAAYLPGQHERAKLMRYDTAVILKRFFFVEESLIISQAGWIAGVGTMEAKYTLARHMWEDSLTADSQRTRVFELRYPSRLMEMGDEEPLMRLVNEARNAPSGLALVQALDKSIEGGFFYTSLFLLPLDFIRDGEQGDIDFSDLPRDFPFQGQGHVFCSLPGVFFRGLLRTVEIRPGFDKQKQVESRHAGEQRDQHPDFFCIERFVG